MRRSRTWRSPGGGTPSATVELGGLRISVDPLLVDRLAHLRRAGAASPDDAACDVDVVLVSHQHADHLHVPSLRRFARRRPGRRSGRVRAAARARRRPRPSAPSRRAKPSMSAGSGSRRWPPPTRASGIRSTAAPRGRDRLPVRGRRPLLLVPGRHRPARRHGRHRAGGPRPGARRRLGSDPAGHPPLPRHRRRGGPPRRRPARRPRALGHVLARRPRAARPRPPRPALRLSRRPLRRGPRPAGRPDPDCRRARTSGGAP